MMFNYCTQVPHIFSQLRYQQVNRNSTRLLCTLNTIATCHRWMVKCYFSAVLFYCTCAKTI